MTPEIKAYKRFFNFDDRAMRNHTESELKDLQKEFEDVARAVTLEEAFDVIAYWEDDSWKITQEEIEAIETKKQLDWIKRLRRVIQEEREIQAKSDAVHDG